ncbi:7-carboxy-7-deazaguanine synthase [Candidatus Methanoperedenaceae archaeon GB50]|nr:MAG: 7-carboxy-7-deazaguanine synthase [Candidatus Methanoperedenaceae archaeon GB50]CAD7776542.1 7-carboxy-7-deazaguanine synthase [Candidatus Methanoperedenaceae archaeon GB50]
MSCRLNFGGFIPLSTIDWYGRAVSVLFYRGCPLRCIYCHNHLLQRGRETVEYGFVEDKIREVRDFVSGVVFSGGEPCAQAKELIDLSTLVKDLDLAVGIETSGFYPDVLSSLVEDDLVDRVFLDIKAPLGDPQAYGEITGVDGAEVTRRVAESLEIVNGMVEVRTTLFRSFGTREFVRGIASELSGRECEWVLRQGVPENAPSDAIRSERQLSRDEVLSLGECVLDLVGNLRIRTIEKGEEKVSSALSASDTH